MEKLIRLFFRITNRLFVFFMAFVGHIWRDKKRLNLNDTDQRRLLVIRHGGFGDLLFISAVLTGLKQRHPGLTIHLMTHPTYHAAFRSHTAIDQVLEHRWPSALAIFSYDYIAFLDGVVEGDSEAETTNIYDLLANKYFGIDLEPTEKKPRLSLELGRRQRLQTVVPYLQNQEILHVGLQLKANSPVRTPDFDVWLRITKTIAKANENLAIYIIAEPEQRQTAESLASEIRNNCNFFSVIQTSDYTPDITGLIALVSLMDAIIAPDSSVTHIAAAFDIPTLGIYGPFPSDLRTRHYRNTVSIDAKSQCAPCFTHGHWPCRKAKASGRINSPCFDELTTAQISESVEKLLTLIRSPGARRVSHAQYRCTMVAAKSETSKFRARILSEVEAIAGRPLETMNGIEIGCGGDAIVPEAIGIDLDFPYTRCGLSPIQFKGNGATLPWFKDYSLDYVYSSHLFEDFDQPENKDVLQEWMRVLKPQGLLILLLPDQQRYLRACARKGELPNEHHRIAMFGPEYLESLVNMDKRYTLIRIVHFWERDPEEYNFLAIIRKN